MKKIFILCLLLSLGSRALTQHTYYHALQLKKFITEGTRDTVEVKLFNTILNKYNLLDTTTNSADISTVEKNPFLSKLIFLDNTPSGTSEEKGPIGQLPNAISSLGSFNVTTIADGLAKFLVKRTKEELSFAFFSRFRDDLNDPRYEDLRILFPQTAGLLNLIDENIYEFSAYLTSLRESFILDLNSLPSSALVVINLPKYKDYFDARPELKHAFQAGLFISHLLVQQESLKHIGSLIDKMPVDQYFPASNGTNFDLTLNGSLKTFRLISRSLTRVVDDTQNVNYNRYWATADSVFMLLNDSVAFKVYLGLIYQEAAREKIRFQGNLELTNILEDSAVLINNVRKSITRFYIGLNSFEDYRRQYKDIEAGLQKDSIKLYYYGLYSTSLSILESGLSIAGQWSKRVESLQRRIIPPLRDAGEIYMYVNAKKHGPAVLSLVKLYKDVFPDSSTNHSKAISKIITHISTYGSFIAQVAKAESSDEVADIIEKTVLPVGGSYIKKRSILNVSLNAYTGFYGGVERQAMDKNMVGVAGLYAPVGIAVSWGTIRKKGPGSVTLFASLIDIGSLVSYRFSNSSDTLKDATIRLNQIVSPGLHLIYGLPKLPVSLGIGGSWSTLLTKVETETIKTRDTKSPFRWQAFVAIDLPLLNFYNKRR